MLVSERWCFGVATPFHGVDGSVNHLKMTEGLKEVANGDEAPGQSGVSSALATAWSTSVTDITWLLQPHLMSAPLCEGQTSKSKATETECRQQDFGSLGGFGPLSRQQHLIRLLFSSSSRCGQIKSIASNQTTVEPGKVKNSIVENL